MTVTEIQAFNGNYCPFIFFDEQDRKSEFCKVYNDGGHYVAIPLEKKPHKHKAYRPKQENEAREIFDGLYAYALLDGKSKTETQEFLRDNLAHLFDSDNALNGFIADELKRKAHNLHARKKRFYRKAFLNKWNYLVTFTYDDKKHTEETFRAKLRKTLSNLHTRRNWRYMGVFERAPETERLHFHALLYVPDGEMLGTITEKQDYSTKAHKMQTTHENDFFVKKYGRNDFKAINPAMRGECIAYVLKYLEKTEERITYSRGIPAEMYMNVEQTDIICGMRDFVIKYVLFDDVIDWETDVQNYNPPEVRGYQARYLC